MIINQQYLLALEPIANMVKRKSIHIDPEGKATSYGLSECGYDIRLLDDIWLYPGKRFVLAPAMEYFHMPTKLMGRVLNKSTWARMGVDVSRSTNIEPGWRGYLTLEITYSKWKPLKLYAGCGIAQVIFEEILTNISYEGKYQDQSADSVEARF